VRPRTSHTIGPPLLLKNAAQIRVCALLATNTTDATSFASPMSLLLLLLLPCELKLLPSGWRPSTLRITKRVLQRV